MEGDSVKAQVLKVHPQAICEKQTEPGTRITGMYMVEIDGRTIAGGYSEAEAWRAALRKVKEEGPAR